MKTLTAALIGFALTAEPALAQDPVVVEGGVPTARVSYGDLDLGSDSGLATLNGRIHRAASRICFEDGRTDLATRLNWGRCYKGALAQAKVQVDRVVADRAVRIASSATIKVAAR
jgi:UrcA family protein